jgi:hypothetical protein
MDATSCRGLIEQYKGIARYLGAEIDEYNKNITHYLFINTEQIRKDKGIEKTQLELHGHHVHNVHPYWILHSYFYMAKMNESKYCIHFKDPSFYPAQREMNIKQKQA